MELYEGRPETAEGRLAREMRTYDYLDRLGIRYQRTDHERADNMEACNEIDAILGVIICISVLALSLFTKISPVLLVIVCAVIGIISQSVRRAAKADQGGDGK